MQFGVFTVGDIAPDPTTGVTYSEAERIQNMIRVAQRADEVGLDVFALGEHHNPPFDHLAGLHRRGDKADHAEHVGDPDDHQ